MIDVKGVSKRYQDGTGTVVAVDRVDLSVKQGEFILVIGRSGSGKSTLLSMLGGLTRPDEGEVRFDGDDLWAMKDTRLSRIRGNRIGFIFQFSGLLPTLTALDNVTLPTLFGGNADTCRERALALLHSFGLGDKAGSYPNQLSGGELKRVAIARALINDPSLILADEPTGDLDVNTERVVMEYLRNINRDGKTIVMVTHSPELSVFADRVFQMENGSLGDITGTVSA